MSNTSQNTVQTVTINDFNFYETVTLFKNKDLKPDSINSVLDSFADTDSKNQLLCKETGKINEADYYFTSYMYERDPSCLKNKGVKELNLAYVLVVLMNEYVAITSKNISNFKELLSHLTPLDYSVFANAFVPEDSVFRKVSMKNLDVSDTAIRSQIIESMNLRNNLSLSQTNHYILNNFNARRKNADYTLSVTPKNSRINKLGYRKNISSFVDWISELLNQISSYNSDMANPLVSTFAESITFNKKNYTPEVILLLLNDSFSNDNYVFFAKDEDGKFQKVESQVQDNLLEKCGTFIEIFGNNVIFKSDEEKLLLENIDFLNSYYCGKEDDTDPISVIDYLNQEQLYIVGFKEHDYRYIGGTLFKDTKLLKRAAFFKDVFISTKNKTKIDCEKYKEKKEIKGETNFKDNSEFHYVEENYKDNDYLVCDDLGSEYADFISLDEVKHNISFYHCKASDGKDGLSASAFQIVLGQAIKNIGSMNIDIAYIKKKNWNGVYTGSNITKIRPTSKNATASQKEIEDCWERINNHPNFSRDIYIVVNFLNMEKVDTIFTKVKNEKRLTNTENQFLWIINSFISQCKEHNITPHIVALNQ